MVEENPIYNYLKAEGLTDLNESDFVAKYTDRTNLQGVYTYLKENGNTDLEFTAFADKYFPLGGAQEVSAQGSAGTSQISGQSSGSLAEPLQGNNIEPNEEIGQAVAQAEASVLDKVGNQYGDMYIPEGTEVVTGLQTDAGRSVAVRGEDGEIYNVIPPAEVTAPARTEPDLGNWESVGNSLYNGLLHVKGLPAKSALLLAQKAYADPVLNAQWQSISAATGMTEAEEVRDWAYSRLDELSNEYRPTHGIIESVRGRDLGALAAGLVDAVTSVLSSVAISAPTFGAGLAVDMLGEGVHSYNTTKAERLGISLDELYSSGRAHDVTPILTSSVGYGFERIGMKGMAQAINRNLTNKFVRNATVLGSDWSKEGLTEWAQLGLETYNEAIASGLSQGEAIQEAGRAMGSEEGSETFLKGFFGSSLVSLGGRAGKRILRKNDREKVSQLNQDLSNITQDASRADSYEARETLLDVAANIADEINTIEASNQDALNALPAEARGKVAELLGRLESLQETMQSPDISEETRTALQTQAEQVSTELDSLIATVPETDSGAQSPATEESATEQAQTEVVSEETASEGQYFTRDIGGEQTVYRRNEDGTASIVPDSESQAILSQQGATPTESTSERVDVDITDEPAIKQYKIDWKEPDDWEYNDETDTYTVGETKNFNIEDSGRGSLIFNFKDEGRQNKQIEELDSPIVVDLERNNNNRVHISGISYSNLGQGFGKEVYHALVNGNEIISTAEGASSTEDAQRVWDSLIRSGNYYWAKIGPIKAVSTSENRIDAFIDEVSDGWKEEGVERGAPNLTESQQTRTNSNIQWDETKGPQVLPGAPTSQAVSGADPVLHSVADNYAESSGITFNRQSKYVTVDEDRAKRIAEEYEKMKHEPDSPVVKEAYENLIRQTTDQYNALVDGGYEFYFADPNNDPYGGNPWNAVKDLRENKRMAVFPTYAGFGSGVTDLDVSNNPMLKETGLVWKDMNGVEHKVLANDLFRAVHDAFGHGLEGAGFRARGEENAWQAHARLFTDSAVGALTTETRGQNSWLNYGPYGEQNRNAKVEDTVFADQKIGLMPEWTWKEGFDGGQQTEVSITPEQAGTVNTALQEQGFTPEESTSFLQDIRTEDGRINRKQAAAERIRQYWQSQQNLGIAHRPDDKEFSRFIRDVAEYAAVSILDGSIRTAKGLAKAIGVTYDENIQQAFEQAQAIVQPIQEATVTPPRTTTKGQIRRSTQGGIQGKVTLTNRQALKTQIQTLNRGIREGRKQIAESRKEITDFIKGMKEAGLFRGKVRGSVVNALINRVNKANTPSQLRNALDYAEKASRIIDYDQKLSTANTLKNRAKRLAKRKGMPADLVPILKGMGGINPRYIDNIDAFNAQVAELISSVDGAGVDGIEQTQHRDLITSVKNKIEQARIQALKDQLIDAGMGSDFVDALNTMNQLLEAVANIPDESKPSGESKREFRERIYEQTKESLGELDRTELSPQQSVALDALLGIDVSQVSDQMMAAIAVVGKNAAVNQSFAGAGPIIAEYRLQQETSNQKNVDKVKSTVRIASRIGKATRERFGTVIAQIDAVMRDQQASSAFYALTGFGDILEGSTRYGHRADGVKKVVEGLSKKHAKDLSDSVQSAMYAMYADLNQYKNTWTEEQRVEEFNKRKEAIQTSIDRIEEQMGRDKHFESQQRDYLSNVKKAWEQVKSAKHPDEIYEKLNNGFKAAYSEMRGFYDSILPEMQDNALIHNNTDLDTDWVNYFPRSYKKLGRPATERKIEQIEEMAGSIGIPLDDIVNQGESSGAKQNRVITGAQLPANATINFDAFNSFYDSSLRALYDIETQPARQYAARALNSGRVAEIFGDATPLEIFRNATIQKISNDQLGLYGGPTSRFRSALRAMSTWGTRLALGGVGQVVKQSIPQMSDAVVRLGNNAHLMAAGLNGYLKYNDLLNEAIKDQPVSRRNVATIERQTSVINKRELNEIRRGLSTGVLRGLGIADRVVEAISLSSLKWGDDMAAKASWLAFYLEYKKRNGETVVDLASELQNPSKDAKAYATQRVELTNNVSDPSLRANTSKHIGSEMLAVIAPFSSFAINAKLELATSLGRLRELGGMNNQERLRTARNIGGNVANILAYNVIGKTIRNIMIGGTASLAYALLNNDDWDDEDEKDAKELIDTWKSDAIARNEENSMEYLVNDLVFGGIAERSLQPGIDVIKDLYAKAKGEQPKERFARPRTIYDALGIFGIPARTAGRFFNDLSEWTMTDAEWQMRKFSIEDSWGETRYVPLEYQGINRPIFSRKGFGLTTLAHGVALTGASSQEVSALANRLPSLISQIETKLHGRDRKDKLAENEGLRKIKVGGQIKELTEEQWEWTVNERRKFLEEVETSDRFVTLQKDELASKVGDELSEKIRRETATKYARAKAIVEFNLVEGVGEKIAEDAKKKASDIISAADLWKKQLNPNTYPKQK